MAPTGNVIILYCVATLIAIIARRGRLPYTGALLVAGVALGSLHIFPVPHLTRELLFALFLPGLLFEASYGLDVRELRESGWTVAALAAPGVVLGAVLTAGLLLLGSRLLTHTAGVSWSTALVFGGVIAATDPVAVTSLLREVRAPRRLQVLLEGESLLNDGTSIVALGLLLAVIDGRPPSVGGVFLDFIRIIAGGAVIGVLVGWGITHVRRQVEDSAIEITLTTIAAYGAFVLAERAQCSGVMATVAAGVMIGHRTRHHAADATSRAAIESFWEWLAFALNSAVFLLLGAEISPRILMMDWPMIVLGAVSALAARSCVVAAVCAVTGRREHLPRSWQVVLSWGGLRGALSLVLALALPETVLARPLIVNMAAGTVLLSLLGQGSTMPMLLRRSRIGA